MRPTRPKLPPKSGYVEIVENGVHKYKAVPSAARLEEMNAKLAETAQAVQSILALLAKLGLGEESHE